MSSVDVLVVGGGPAGLAAAAELKRLGIARVSVLDREPEAGGVPRHCHHTGFGLSDLRRMLSGPGYARKRRALAEDSGAEIRTATTALAFSGPTALMTTSPLGLDEISARAVVLATGCRERPRAARLVPGTRPLGVYTTGSLQQIVYGRSASPGKRAVVVGAEHVSFSAAHTLIASGASVAAIVTELAAHQSYEMFRLVVATRHGIPVVTRARLSRIAGRARVEAVELLHLDTGRCQEIACDTVVFTGDWIPDHELARSAAISINAGTRGPRVDTALRTSRRGVFAAGNLLHGAAIADVAAFEGVAAARGIADFFDHGNWPSAEPALPVTVEPPLAWITPSHVSLGALSPPRGRFVFQAREFRERAAIQVRQAGALLYTKRLGRLVPNRALDLDGAWTTRARKEGGAIVVSVA